MATAAHQAAAAFKQLLDLGVFILMRYVKKEKKKKGARGRRNKAVLAKRTPPVRFRDALPVRGVRCYGLPFFNFV